MLRSLSIDRAGTSLHGKTQNMNLIHRLRERPFGTIQDYLIASDELDEISTNSDIITIADPKAARELIHKKKVHAGLGIEVLISDVRKKDGTGVGKWISEIKELQKICSSSKCQFILSSGATSVNEMVSGPSFDSLLKICGMEPASYWFSLNRWLEARLAEKTVITNDVK